MHDVGNSNRRSAPGRTYSGKRLKKPKALGIVPRVEDDLAGLGVVNLRDYFPPEYLRPINRLQ